MNYSEVDIIMKTSNLVNRCRNHVLQVNKGYKISKTMPYSDDMYTISYYDQFGDYNNIDIDMTYFISTDTVCFKKTKNKKGYKSIWNC